MNYFGRGANRREENIEHKLCQNIYERTRDKASLNFSVIKVAQESTAQRIIAAVPFPV